MGHREHVLMQLAPVLSNGYSVLGEVEKVVPMASARVMDMTVQPNGVLVEIRGTAGEVVTFWFLSPDGKTFSASCTVTDLGTATFVVSSSTGKCQG